jgi:predicted hydrocarbon binding protein
MTPTVQETALVRLGPETLHALRSSLEKLLGGQAAQPLLEAGFSCGGDMYRAFGEWLERQFGVADPADLDAEVLGELLSGFFVELGWGEVTVTRLGSSALAIDAPAWAESSQTGGAQYPSCHLTTGLFSAFLERLAEGEVAVMEVECRTRGDARCRFLAGAPETLQAVFDAVSAGADYEQMLSADQP